MVTRRSAQLEHVATSITQLRAHLANRCRRVKPQMRGELRDASPVWSYLRLCGVILLATDTTQQHDCRGSLSASLRFHEQCETVSSELWNCLFAPTAQIKWNLNSSLSAEVAKAWSNFQPRATQDLSSTTSSQPSASDLEVLRHGKRDHWCYLCRMLITPVWRHRCACWLNVGCLQDLPALSWKSPF